MAGFVRRSNDLIDSGILDTLSLCATRVYSRLERLAGKSGRCWPGLGTLGKWVGFCVRSVGSAIRELISSGLVKKVRRGARNRATVYQIVREPVQGAARNLDADLPLFSQTSQANLMSVGSSSQAMRLPTTQKQPVTQKQQQAGVVAFERTEEERRAVVAILQRTDAPRERAEAMARDYPLQVIELKLRMLATAKGVRSSGAWLSAALASDYRGPEVFKRLNPEDKERRRLAEIERQEKRRKQEAEIRMHAGTPEEVAEWARNVRERMWRHRVDVPQSSGLLAGLMHRTSDQITPAPAEFVRLGERLGSLGGVQ